MVNTKHKLVNTKCKAVNTICKTVNAKCKAVNTNGKVLNINGKAVNANCKLVNIKHKGQGLDVQSVTGLDDYPIRDIRLSWIGWCPNRDGLDNSTYMRVTMKIDLFKLRRTRDNHIV